MESFILWVMAKYYLIISQFHSVKHSNFDQSVVGVITNQIKELLQSSGLNNITLVFPFLPFPCPLLEIKEKDVKNGLMTPTLTI